jgi:MFS family permease
VESGGVLLGFFNWLSVISVLAGGIIAQRWGYANLLVVVGMSVGAVATLALLWTSPSLPLLVMALSFGLPAGVILALPAEVLRPEARALGIGIFQTWLYIGMAALPLAAGKLQDIFHHTGTSLVFAALLVLLLLILFGLFRLLQISRDRAFRPAQN